MVDNNDYKGTESKTETSTAQPTTQVKNPADVEVQKLSDKDAASAKKKGGFFGDPIFVTNE